MSNLGLDSSQVHVEANGKSNLPTVSRSVPLYPFFSTYAVNSGGWTNPGFSTYHDEDANAFAGAAPSDVTLVGKSQSYSVSRVDAASAPGTEDAPASRSGCSRCCDCRSWSCRAAGLIVGGVILVVCLLVGLVVGLVLGLSPKATEEKKLFLAGSLKFNLTWFNDYTDPSSRSYQQLSSSTFSLMSSILDNSSFSDVYVLHEIVNFKKGSVLVNFRLDVNVTAATTSSEILAVLQKGFQNFILAGVLQGWLLDPNTDIWIAECDASEFRCSDGTCLLQKFVCDRVNDCDDYSDERSCTCSKTEFSCDTGLCIESWRQCDKNYDCPDKSDEKNCTCPMGQYACINGTCIMSEWLCDREKDCLDGEDESNCGSCLSDQFQCKDYSCTRNSSRCNGISDCPDLSDEQNCVRQDIDLKVTGFSSTMWLPFCSTGVTTDINNLLCLALGMSGVVSSSSVYSASMLFLKLNATKSHNVTNVYNLMLAFDSGTVCPNNSALVLQCEPRLCGTPAVNNLPQGLIVHGTDAPPGRWPWQAAIYMNLLFICGGSLVDHYHIVTAAHCVVDDHATYAVLLGSNMRAQTGAHGKFYSVRLIERHPKYVDYFYGYDIAVLTLKEEVNYTDYIRPICLTEAGDEVSLSSICYSTGWGNTDYNKSDYLPEVLQQAKMKLWPFDECQLSYLNAIPVMLCSGYASGYIANCAGDSGGPLVCKDPRGFWKLVGVFSFLTKGCSVPEKPSVFTNVQEVFSWIEDKMTCKFNCSNGKCIWDLRSLCDGVDDCGDLTDEYRTCSSSISCNFETSYICGYRNLAQGPLLGRWTRKAGPAGVNEGPIMDATFGNISGHYMYSDVRQSILMAPIYHQTEPHCLQFKLNVRALHSGGFRVFLKPTTLPDIPPSNISLDNITSLFEWPVDCCQLDLWQAVVVDIEAGTFILAFEAFADIGQTSASIAIDDIRLLNGTCASQVCDSKREFTCVMDGVCIPSPGHCNFYTDCIDASDELNCSGIAKSYTCDFERYGSCGLEQSTLDTIDWIVRPASEAASIAGCPKSDHTSNSSLGNIFFISTLYGNPGDLARVSLPIKTASSPGCFRMYYSMISQGLLKVDFISSSNVWLPAWSISQANVTSWQLLQLVLPVGVSVINIDGVNGVESAAASTSYIALDDFSISEGNCTKPVCTSHEYTCDDGLCIYHEHTCDGIDDCRDNSDEKSELCVCRPESLFCGSGECLQGHVRCDGVKNCRDNSDELNCNKCDYRTEYNCTSDGRCKLRSTWCDGTIDCNDGSDELADCKCLPEQFRCANGHCILAVEYCNSRADCADASDEPVGCSCSNVGLVSCHDGSCGSPCNLVSDCVEGNDELNCTNYKCFNGSNISSSQRCDGHVDCSQAEDEFNCQCGPTDFHCTAGRCISRAKVCNGQYDCPDFSDERNCSCSIYQFRCASGICLPSYTRCNTYSDCGDYSDEQNCTCNVGQFQCNNGICLSSAFRCDFNDDCGDGSDEVNCPCKSKELQCSDGRCIQPEWLCDGYPDCKDGSDESNCSRCNNSTQFTCRLDYTCISLSSRCDGTTDCHDASDEHGCVVQKTVNGMTNILYGYRNGSFYPICSENWSENWSSGACSSFGSGNTIAMSSIALPSSNTFLRIQTNSSTPSYNLSYLDLTPNCPDKNAVRLTCLPSTCGQQTYSSIVPFIIRGDLATEGQWPWMAALLYNGVYRCSATLITTEWIMTAAHCVHNSVNGDNGYSLVNVPQYFTAVLGTTKRTGFSSHLQVVTFRRVLVNEAYAVTNGVPYNDIALLQLNNSVTTGDFVNPICLPKTSSSPRGSLCYAAGWGVTTNDYGAGAPIDLRQAKMEIWTHQTCSLKEFWGSFINNETQFCAGYASGNIAMCGGDSGGPLMCRDLNNRWALQGVVSAGSDDCVRDVSSPPTIFTNVQHFMPWIAGIIRQYRR